MPSEFATHDCDYESVEAPGRRVVPLIVHDVRPLQGALERFLQRVETMRPGELYRCTRCGVYVYVTRQYQALRLRAAPPPSGMAQAC
jgi:hypothetical protein